MNKKQQIALIVVSVLFAFNDFLCNQSYSAEKLSPLKALRILKESGLIAKPHYNEIPDGLAIGRASLSANNKVTHKEKLDTIVIPEVKSLLGFTMAEAINLINTAIRENDPKGTGVALIINEYIDPGGEIIAGPTLSSIQTKTGEASMKGPDGNPISVGVSDQKINFKDPPPP